MAEAGLADRIEIRLLDYRDLPGEGQFDRIASVGMFEHVGRSQLEPYFRRLHDMLRPGGPGGEAGPSRMNDGKRPRCR